MNYNEYVYGTTLQFCHRSGVTEMRGSTRARMYARINRESIVFPPFRCAHARTHGTYTHARPVSHDYHTATLYLVSDESAITGKITDHDSRQRQTENIASTAVSTADEEREGREEQPIAAPQ